MAEEEQKRQVAAATEAARRNAKQEAKLHRAKGEEFFRRHIPEDDPLYHEAVRIVHQNQQAFHNNPIVVVGVEQVYNAKLKTRFFECKQDLIDPTQEPIYKFHGTEKAGVDGICKEGFRQPDAECPNMDKKSGGKKLPMYGHGVYFASDSTKSAQMDYTKGSNMLLVCKVLLGKCLTLEKPNNHLDKGSLRKKHKSDSVFAPAGTAVTFDEFVVYDARQAVAEYVVHFRPAGFGNLPSMSIGSGGFSIHSILPSRTFDANSSLQMHFHIAESRFLRMPATGACQAGAKLLKVEYVTNPALIKQFDAQQAEFRRQKIPSEPVLAFHATGQRATVDKIVRNNFDPQFIGSQTDSGYWGRGFYFSEFPSTSTGYGTNLLLCKVLLGKTFDVSQRCDGQPLKAGYNSHRLRRDANGYGQELVVDNPKQILPCYILHIG